MKELVRLLSRQGTLKTPRLMAAFLETDRKKFVPRDLAADAYIDTALPIGEGQTISQPSTVAMMLEHLDPRPGQKVLDVGFGSGWTTALLAHAVGPNGRVYALEVVPEIFQQGRRNLKNFALQNIVLYNQSGWEGLPEEAPFDRILVSATGSEIPAALKRQLLPGGKLVIPVGLPAACALHVLQKKTARDFHEEIYPGFAFVTLVR